jgi:hypothetical protein
MSDSNFPQSNFTPEQEARIHRRAAEIEAQLRAGEKAMVWKFGARPWRSKHRRWGVEVLHRRPLRHSQVRVHAGRRHLTFGWVAYGPARKP